jgi:acyl carrier protein
MNTQTDIETRLKSILKKVLDIKESEIVPGAKLDESLGIDSTEMVEISVAIKKELGVPVKDNELKKTHSFNEIAGIIMSKMESDGGCGSHSCGCKH